MIRGRTRIAVVLAGGLLSPTAMPREMRVSAEYRALDCQSAPLRSTWAVMERDGAGRPVDPYLSSLGKGETGTGVISSPPFVIAGDTITFTVCGHDGSGGGRGENYLALVDAGTGETLMRTAPPMSDDMKVRSWDVGKLNGVKVRIEAHDGNSSGAFAWFGVGRIDAAPAMRVDFRKGLPEGWDWPERQAVPRYELVTGGIPFRRNPAVSTVIPRSGAVELPCGFPADRLFFLGCTVSDGEPLATHGGIEIHYRTGSPDVFPLMCGFTLLGEPGPQSSSKSSHLHVSGDPGQYYLVVVPRDAVIESIRLVAGPDRRPIPRITAITCQTTASNDHLEPLPQSAPSGEEAAWIGSHAISAESPQLESIVRHLRKAYRLAPAGAGTTVCFQKHKLDGAFRSEGVAVADFNGDGHLDIAAGSVYYAGPDWKMVPMLGEPKEFNRSGYSDAFLCFHDDVDRNGATDLIVVGFPGRETHWLQNPGKAGSVWRRHLAVERTGNESPTYADVDGDGRRELLFMDGGRCVSAQPPEDPTRRWTLRPISGPSDPAPGHGLGVGDVSGDGRADVLIPDGWWEGSPERGQLPWRFHGADLFGGAQLCVWDCDGDGDGDVLGSSAHAYGIAWSEQTPGGWRTHEIDSDISQTHALQLADLDRDGLMDFVTGKRFWAHNGHDPGSFEPAVLCWFEQKRKDGLPEWVKHVIDVDSGVGLHFEIADVDRDGLSDIVTSNKKGVYLFRQTRNPD